MLRFLLTIYFVIVSTFSSLFVFAEGVNDIASPDFQVSTCDMDPMHQNCGSFTITGKDAFQLLLGKVSTILLYMVPIIAAVSFMVAGYYYVLSAGDSEKVSQAKTIIKWNIVAVCVAFFSLTIIKIIQYIIT
ncbi:MAG: hypothetical protein HHAS10_07320 [Candidatus Altimarinota bacterium]